MDNKKREELFQNITYGEFPEIARRLIFEKAWELGHSGGDYEVEMYYNDLTELVEKIMNLL